MKRYQLSTKDKKIAGVCGGLSEYFEIDVTVIRLAMIFAAALTAFAPLMIAYLIAWAITPRNAGASYTVSDPETYGTPPAPPSPPEQNVDES